MEPFKFFLEGVEAGRYAETDWLLSVINVSDLPFSDEMIDFQPYDLAMDRDTKKKVFYDPVAEGFSAITGLGQLDVVLDYKATYNLKANQLPNLTQDIRTTGGTLIANLILSVLPFKDLIPYVNKKCRPSDFNSQVEIMLKNGTITIDQYLYYCECVSFLNNLWGVVPTGSKKTMTVSKSVISLRDQLLKEHANELDNPVVMADIEARLIKADEDDFKGDPAEDFFVSKKSRAVSRKKAKILYGLDDGLGGKPSVNIRSLNEGLKPEDIPLSADIARAASYSRGFLTAQGGELVNYLYRVFMNTKIASDDCGTKNGLNIKISDNNMKRYIDRYAFDDTGKTILLDQAYLKSKVDKTILVRSPGRCKEKNQNFCAFCTDKFFYTARETVHIETSLPGSKIMDDRMKAMHGRVSAVRLFDYQVHYT